MIRRIRAIGRSRLAAFGVVARNRDLRSLEGAWFLFNLAEYAFVVGLGVYAFEVGGAVAVGVVTLIRTAPALVSAPIAAAFTDRLRREVVMRVGLVARFAAAAGIVALLAADAPAGAVYVAAAADAVAASLFWPAHTALIPELGRSAQELTAANSVSSGMESLGTLVGPGLAAIGLALWEPAAVFIVGAVAVLAALVVASRIRTDRVVPSNLSVAPVADVVEGFRYAVSSRDVRTIVGLWTLESFVLGVTEVFIVLVAIDVAGFGEPGVGVLNAMTGLGGLVGATALATARRGYPYGKILGISLAAYGVALVAPGVSTAAVVALGAFTVVGLAAGHVDIAAQTMLQRLVREDHLARILGAFEGMYWGSLGLGAITGSALVVWLGIRPALVVTGAVLAVLAVLARAPLRSIDRGLVVPTAELELLGRVPGLSELPVPTLEHLARSAKMVSVGDGTPIVSEGEVGDCFYVVAEGRVVVVVQGSQVKELGPGDHFGEIALLNGQPRMADVVAVGDVSLRSIDGDVLVTAVTGHLRSEEAMASVMVARLAESARYRRHGFRG
jgi:MFS family permease